METIDDWFDVFDEDVHQWDLLIENHSKSKQHEPPSPSSSSVTVRSRLELTTIRREESEKNHQETILNVAAEKEKIAKRLARVQAEIQLKRERADRELEAMKDRMKFCESLHQLAIEAEQEDVQLEEEVNNLCDSDFIGPMVVEQPPLHHQLQIDEVIKDRRRVDPTGPGVFNQSASGKNSLSVEEYPVQCMTCHVL